MVHGRPDQGRVTDRLMEYCRIDSAPMKEGALAEALRRDLSRLGFSVTEDEAGRKIGGEVGNLIARLPGRHHKKNDDPLLLSAHLDRVAEGIGIRPRIENGAIVSAGDTILGADDAAGIAAIVEACTLVRDGDVAHPPIEVVLTVAEEVGLVGAKQLDMGQLAAKYGYVLDADAPVGTIITQTPTKYTLTCSFYGRSAHAGIAPERGVSAIKIAAAAVARMRLGKIDETTTANVGYIAGGGPTNIVPDWAEIRAEARGLHFDRVTEQVKDMLDAARAAAEHLGGKEESEATVDFQGFHLDRHAAVVTHAIDAARKVGLLPAIGATGGGSDANVFNAAGLSTAVLGVGYRHIHTFRESMPVDELVRLSHFVYGIITRDHSITGRSNGRDEG